MTTRKSLTGIYRKKEFSYSSKTHNSVLEEMAFV